MALYLYLTFHSSSGADIVYKSSRADYNPLEARGYLNSQAKATLLEMKNYHTFKLFHLPIHRTLQIIRWTSHYTLYRVLRIVSFTPDSHGHDFQAIKTQKSLLNKWNILCSNVFFKCYLIVWLFGKPWITEENYWIKHSFTWLDYISGHLVRIALDAHNYCFSLHKLVQKDHYHRLCLDPKPNLLTRKALFPQVDAYSSWSYLTFLNTHKTHESTLNDFWD